MVVRIKSNEQNNPTFDEQDILIKKNFDEQFDEQFDEF